MASAARDSPLNDTERAKSRFQSRATGDDRHTVIRCPDCGGLNPAEADWCGQCLKRFTPPPAPEPVAEARPEAEIRETPTTEAPLSLVESLPTAADASISPPHAHQLHEAAIGKQHGPFTVTNFGVAWTCATCGTFNPITSEACQVCGATLRQTVEPGQGKVKKKRDPRLTAMIALAFPGAGHGYLGLWGEAVARIAIGAWLLAAVIAGLSVDAAGSKVLGFVFVVFALGMWAVSAHDAYRAAEGQPNLSLLKGRMFLYLVLVLLGLLFVQLFMGASAGNNTLP